MEKAKISLMAAAAICALATITGCAGYTPDIRQATADDSHAIADFSNKVLLDNIERASKYLPVNYSDLSSISDSKSFSVGTGSTIPFGPKIGTNDNSATPSITYSASPTASVSSLNNTGFVVAMLQPVSGQYLISKWNNSSYDDDHRILLYLMIKSIQMPVHDVAGHVVRTVTLVNDPEHPQAYPDQASPGVKFDTFIEALLAQGESFRPKSLTVAEELGTPFQMSHTVQIQNIPVNALPLVGPLDTSNKTKSVSSSTPASPKNGVAVQSSGTAPAREIESDNYSDLTALMDATGLNDGQYHIGNAGNCDGAAYAGHPATASQCGREGQMYRMFPAQVALCASLSDNRSLLGIVVAKLTGSGLTPPDTGSVLRSLAKASGSSGSSQSAASGSGGGGGAGGGGAGAAGGASQPSAQLSQTLPAQRISALVDSDGCLRDEIVVKAASEQQFADDTADFIHIEWRSPADMIEYLGAVLRHGGSMNNIDAFSIDNGAPAGRDYLVYEYGGTKRYVARPSVRILRIVSELVNLSKLSAGSQITQPVLFVP